MNELNFRLDTFEGPLDLLLKLIVKNKVSIYDIPIAVIFDQYMEYIDEMRRMDMEIAGSFITMAAELMLIKSRMLLPKPENASDEDDPRAALAAALAEYHKIKLASGYFSERYGAFGSRIVREMSEPDADVKIEGIDPMLLRKAFIRIMNHTKELEEAKNEPVRTISSLYGKKLTPISVRIIAVMRYLYKCKTASFEDIMLQSKTRSDVIASFAALLELLHSHRVTIDDDMNVTLNRKVMNDEL